MRIRPSSARRRSFGLAAAFAAGALLVGCQPVDRLPEEDQPALDSGTAPPDAPPSDQAAPEDLDEVLAKTQEAARQWQREPKPVEVLVRRGEDGWDSTVVTYLAPDADRLLLVTVTGGGVTHELIRFEGLELVAVPAAALGNVPPLPGDVRQPEHLLEQAAEPLQACGIDQDPDGVLYATGAPAAWDGERWTDPPGWSVTVTAGPRGVLLDPATGLPLADPCVGG